MRNLLVKWQQLAIFALTPAVKPVLRDFIAVWFMLGQGLIRLIDGLLFVTTPTRLLDSDIYGVAQVIGGIWLLATRSSEARSSTSGKLAAALAVGVYCALAWDVMPRSATSGIPAIGVALAMLAEARYVATD